jgi:hypothetical protein
MSKKEVIQLWLDAEEENRSHTQAGEDKCLELKNRFSDEYNKFSVEDQEYVSDYLEEIGV